ncbi:hypothetical protein FQN55_007631 [Onygenales sp. PD_40]|nr:hypothetical protein FQN55_007631 [Onygenales sp. PD_40]KAK2776762.1 hypothetical protein FQN53_002478 [Emmonsiellopsis sp. PD_33]KAK2792154.1 hypothetical protein FQN52_003922 [Onygenales sp. PD_12]KAK2798262.1 hypothetical protein FQN51_007828 [Onygenales sp. PD_10]
MEPPSSIDHYTVLGVAQSATSEDIRKAYKKKAIETHPDKNGDAPESVDAFQKVQDAFEILYDDEKRKKYDKAQRSRQRSACNRGHTQGPNYAETPNFQPYPQPFMQYAVPNPAQPHTGYPTQPPTPHMQYPTQGPIPPPPRPYPSYPRSETWSAPPRAQSPPPPPRTKTRTKTHSSTPKSSHSSKHHRSSKSDPPPPTSKPHSSSRRSSKPAALEEYPDYNTRIIEPRWSDNIPIIEPKPRHHSSKSTSRAYTCSGDYFTQPRYDTDPKPIVIEPKSPGDSYKTFFPKSPKSPKLREGIDFDTITIQPKSERPYRDSRGRRPSEPTATRIPYEPRRGHW